MFYNSSSNYNYFSGNLRWHFLWISFVKKNFAFINLGEEFVFIGRFSVFYFLVKVIHFLIFRWLSPKCLSVTLILKCFLLWFSIILLPFSIVDANLLRPFPEFWCSRVGNSIATIYQHDFEGLPATLPKSFSTGPLST